MSTHDPIATALGGIHGPVDPRPEFAEALLGRLLEELEPRTRRRLGTRTLLLAAAVLLLLAATATATYLIERTVAVTPLDAPPGTLTLIDQTSNGVAKIVAVTPGGTSRVVWRCPRHVRFCGDLTSVDWSPDGKRVAFTLDEIGGRSAYVGLHILDVRTGRDLHIPSIPPLAHPLAPTQPEAVLAAAAKQVRARLGCLPADVAWSPDGRRLAYGCRNDFTPWAPARIYTIATDGTGRRLVRTGTRTAFDPSWSPDGSRIVFATWRRPVETVQWDTAMAPKRVHSRIYEIRLDGSGRKLLARDAASPDWSPDGSGIAYDSPEGVKLVSPSGVDLTPRAGRIAPPGVPSWSPDASQIAVATAKGTMLVDTGTWTHTVATATTPDTLYGLGRPAWYAGAAAALLRGPHQYAAHCRVCL